MAGIKGNFTNLRGESPDFPKTKAPIVYPFLLYQCPQVSLGKLHLSPDIEDPITRFGKLDILDSNNTVDRITNFGMQFPQLLLCLVDAAIPPFLPSEIFVQVTWREKVVVGFLGPAHDDALGFAGEGLLGYFVTHALVVKIL